MDYITRDIISQDWVTFLLVGCVILYAMTKYFYPQRFQEFILLPITNKYFLVQGKHNEIQHPFNIILFIAQIISVSLFIYLLVKTANPDTISDNRWVFVQICTAYTGFILVKYYLEKIISAVFSLESYVNQYLYEKITYRNLLAIAIFLGNLVFFYMFRPSLLMLLVFFGMVIVLNAVSVFYSYKTNGKLIFRNFFYFILYLCALEISPYFILYKVFIEGGEL